MGHGAFHFLLVEAHFEPPGAVLERVKPHRAGVAFLEGSDFAFNDSGAFENAFFDALAEGCGSGEESLLGAGNHDLLFEAALGAAAWDQVAFRVLGIGDSFQFHTLFIGAAKQGLEGFFFKGVGIFGAPAARDVDDVEIASLVEPGEVGARGKSGVEDDPELFYIILNSVVGISKLGLKS